MSLTKADLVESLHNKQGLTRKTSRTLIESLLETIKQTLVSGEDVRISGFGKFCVNGKTQRRGRNPATGNDLMLDARRIVTFRCSAVYKNKLNEKP